MLQSMDQTTRTSGMRRVPLVVLSVIVSTAILATGAFALQRLSQTRAMYATCRPAVTLVCLTRSASNHTTTVRKGDTVEVTLSGTTLRWTAPKVVGARLLRPIGTALSRGGARRERFKAVRAGHTIIQASATAKCSPGEICPQFALLWRAAIVVVN